MTEVRNPNGKLVCRLDKNANVIEIVIRHCVTTIRLIPNNVPEITHCKLNKIKK